MSWFKLYCFALFASGWISLNWARSFDVPDILSYGMPTDWFYVEYEQSIIINNITYGQDQNLWSIKEYFKLDPAVSVAFHRNTKTSVEYILVAFEGHFYHCKAQNKDQLCRQDLRQGYTSIYPWRYSTRHQIGKPSKALVGVGGIWKNAIGRQLTCQRGSVNELICSFVDKYLNWMMTFGQPRGGPLKIKLQQYHTIHEDGKSVVDSIVAEIYIKSFRVFSELANEEERRIQGIMSICEHSESFSTPTFPSLLRTISESAQKNYHLSYKVIKSPGKVKDSKLLPTESYSVDEWFSYTEKMQSFWTSRFNHADISLGHQYYRLLGLKNKNMCVSYEVEWLNTEPKSCKFRQFDDENLAKTPMFQRPIRFVDHEHLNGGTMDYHENNLLGLGALLSNVHDSQHKYLNYVHETPRDTGVTRNEWIVDDSERSGQRFHLLFKTPSSGVTSACHLSSLLRVEIYRKNLDGPIELHNRPDQSIEDPGEDAALEKVLNYNLDVTIEVYKYTTYLYPGDKRQAFEIPEQMCPTVEDVSDDADGEEVIKESDRGVSETTIDSEDLPEFDEILALQRNYRISSTWTFETGRIMKLVEYLYFDDDKKVARIDDLNSKECYYICYADNKILTFDGEVCAPVDGLDEDLEEYSSPMTLYGLANHCSLHHYGLGNLLRLSSRAEASLIEFLGGSPLNSGLHRQWKIKLNDINKDVVLHYAVEKKGSGDKISLRLNSASVKESNLTVLTINDIKIQYADMLDVAIPPACNVTSDRTPNQQEFPTFKQIFLREPKEATFSILYHLFIESKGNTHELTGFESCKDRDCLTDMWDTEGIKLRTLTECDRSVDTFLYEPRRQLCIKCISLMNLFGLNEIVRSFVTDDDHLSLDENALLIVNLWQILGDKIAADNIVPTEKEIDLDGQMYLRFEWKIENQIAEISFEFDKKLDHTNAPLTLSTILIQSSLIGNESMRFTFDHSRQVQFDKEPLQDECRAVLDQDRYIPMLSDAFKGSKIFYMRSQLVHNGHVQQVDEWYEYDTAYRLMISNLVESEINIKADYLVLKDTGELFNLTTVDECDLMTGLQSTDWFHEQTLKIQHEAGLYGPLFLWSLAANRDTRVQQVPDDRLDPDKLFDHDYRDYLFDTELWSLDRIQSPLLETIIRFGRDIGKREMIPEEIRVIDGQDHREIASLEVLNMIPIAGTQNRQRRHMLLVPKGRGCKRSKLAHEKWTSEGMDSYEYHISSLASFKYLATLNMVQNGRLVPNLIVQTGSVSKCPSMGSPETLENLKTTQWQVQDVHSGTVVSYRQVESRIAPRSNYVQKRLLEQDTGRCILVGPVKIEQNSEILSLDLAGKTGEPILLKDSLLTSFEMNESGFEPIHRYEDDEDSIVSVYEYRTSRIELNSRLIGPGSIIRTLVRTKTVEKDDTNHYRYASVKLEIILFGKAHLILNINDIGEQDCFSILTKARALDCHSSTDMEYALRDSGIDAGNRMRTIGLYFAPFEDNSFAEKSDSTDAKSDYIAHTIGMKLITEADAIDPMQLGDIEVVFHEDSLISAYISLIEPLSPVHAFELEPGRVLKRCGSKMLLHMRVMQSLYVCSEWCGSMDHCAAFSYCSDKMCSILTGMDTGSENLLESYGEDKSTCSLYHKNSESSSKPVSDIIGLIQKNIDNDDQSNKFSFVVPSKGEKSIIYIARKIETVFNDEFPEISNAIDGHQEEKHTFVTLKTDRAFLLEDRKSSASISFDLSRSLSECLEACDKVGALLCSYCTRSEVCRAVTNVTSWKDYIEVEDDTEEDHMNRCTIYSIDYTKDYHRLTDTSRPPTYLRADKNVGLIECAAICSLGMSKGQAEANLTQCLSFDYCFDTTTGENTCYTQQNHIVMTDFSETAYANKSASDKCYHYSKNLVSDFTLMKEKKFRFHETNVRAGMTLDKCAILCHLDPEENCIGFEYCYQDMTQPSTCYIKRFFYHTDHLEKVDYNDSTHAEVIVAPGCSVYLLKNNSLNNDYTIIDKSISDSLSNKTDDTGESDDGSLIHLSLANTIMFSFLALVLGIAVQNARMIRRSRSVPR